jgi:hypothetical protein
MSTVTNTKVNVVPYPIDDDLNPFGDFAFLVVISMRNDKVSYYDKAFLLGWGAFCATEPLVRNLTIEETKRAFKTLCFRFGQQSISMHQ